MASRNVLVVTGDYGVVQQVKQALGGKNFVIHAAYSHLDAVYQLQFEPFELVLVDASMINRKTGERTALTLTEMEKHPPLLVYSPKNSTDRWSADGVVNTLDEETLARIVTRILHLTPQSIEVTTEPKRATGTVSPANTTAVFWRDEEMQTLFALGRSLTEVLDLSEVLNRIVGAARSLTNAEEGMILLPDGQSGQLYLRAKVGIDVEVADNFRIKTQDTIAGAVFESGQPVLLGESGPQKVKTEYFVNSLLYVPIIQKGHTLGVLGVNNKTKHDVFTELHRDLLINLATYAAIAIENARVHGQSIRRQHELKALIDASQVINESLSFDRTLPAICQQLIHLLNVNQAEIHTWMPEQRQLHLLARYQQTVWRNGHEPILKLAERPLVRQALETRRYNFVERGHVEIQTEIERLDQARVRAMLIVPVLAGDQVFGALQAYYVNSFVRGGEVTNDMILRVQRMMLEMLASPGSGEDNSYSLKLLQDVRTVLGADWIEYAALLPESAGLQLQFALGGGVWVDQDYPSIVVADYPDLLDVLEKQQALNQCIGDENLSAGGRALFKATRSRSLLALPLIGRGRAMGLVLFMDTLHSRAFTPREIDLGRTIVGQAATALQNISLVRDLEVSVSELKDTQNRLVQTARLSAMGELAAAVAHQINNPLTTIVLDSELLLETESPNTTNYEVISAISRAGKRAAGVVHRLLAMARPISVDADRHEVDVPYTIEDTVALVQPHIEREGIRMTVRLPGEKFPNVLAASSELNDVWLNLILNAHDAVVGQDAPEIGITSSYDGANELIEVTVWDNGPGIPDEILGEIFKPFFTTKPEGEGTGLGLHLSRQVVERVGGTISVQTSASGTQFVVRLPIMRST